jgi:hypothetical protein
MSLTYSPKIILDGLVLCLDPSQNKSYPSANLSVKDGLILWLDSSDDSSFSYSSGTLVSQWRDKSGLNNHANQSTAANQPTRNSSTNSRKTVTFDGTNDFLDGTSTLALANGYTAFTIVKSSATGERDILTSSPFALSADIYLYQRASDGRLGNWPTVYTSNVISLSTWYLLSVAVSSAGSETLYLNGSSQTSSSRSITNTRGYRVAANSSGSEYWSGEIAEIIVFNRQLTTTELNLVHTYLGQKWGISNTDRSIIDLSGNNNNGLFGNATVANMPDYDFYNKGAFKFNGTSDFVKVGPNSSLQVNNVTIAAFFKTVNNGQGVQFIAGYGDTGIAGYWLGTSGGPIRFSIGGGSGNYLQQSSGVTPNNDQIYYVVGTYDGVNQRVYVDGVLQASATTVTGNISYTGLTDGFLLGQVQGFSAARYLTGNIYNVSVYSRALSQAEISQNYEALKSKFTNTIVQQGLVLNLDAGNPYSYSGAGSTWYDVSGAGYNATAVNSPTITSDSIKYFTLSSSQNFTISNPISSQGKLTQVWTVSAWVNVDVVTGAGARYLISGLNEGLSVDFYDSGTLLYLAGGADDYYTYGNAVEGTGWIFLTFLFRNSDGYRKIYSNLVDITTSGPNNTSTPSGNSATFTIGNNMRGKIAHIMMYNRLLSIAEVTQNYNATKARFGF